MLCVVAAMVWANGPGSKTYFDLWATQVSLGFGGSAFAKSLLHWINDGLMAVFFLVVGLEIKRELLVGELSSLKQAALPLFAAVGGMVAPAAIFAIVAAGTPGSNGWGIPMATDIAFSLGVLSLLGTRAPLGLKVFLAALAIIDDIGAVLVIALFYTDRIDGLALGAAAAVFAALLLVNRLGIRWLLAYAVLGLGLWICLLNSGIHATIAGILTALAIPARVRLDRSDFRNQIQSQAETLSSDSATDYMTDVEQSAVHQIEVACEDVQMPLERAKRLLHPWQTFLIVPVFALANSGIVLQSETLSGLSKPVSVGIMLGLVVGKPLGIMILSRLSVALGCAALPAGVSWRHVLGASVLAGIGFTMSLFIADLARFPASIHDAAKLAIFAGSLFAAILGFVLVRSAPPSSQS
jgi:NhaA family Na+:H+ antiporter